MKKGKKALGLLITVIALVFVAAFCAAAQNTGLLTVSDTAVIEDDVSEYEVSTAQELIDIIMCSDGTVPAEVTVKLTNDIQMTDETLFTANSKVTDITIDGQNYYTLKAPDGDHLQYCMFYIGNSVSCNLTFENITIDANDQQIIHSYANASECDMENVVLKNLHTYVKGTDSAVCFQGSSSGNATSQHPGTVTMNNVSTEDCIGPIGYFYYTKGLNITNSNLSTSWGTEDTSGAVPAIYFSGKSGYLYPFTIDNSQITWTDDSHTMYGIDVAYCTLTLQNNTELCGVASDTGAIYSSGARVTIILNDCTIHNSDDTRATVSYSSLPTFGGLSTNGNISGEPIVQMYGKYSNGTTIPITITGALTGKLYFSFLDTSIAGYDPQVAVGTEDYTLSQEDIENLVYYGDELYPPRTLTLDEDNNAAMYYRPDLQDCDVEVSAEGTITGTDGNILYLGSVNDGEVKPSVISVTLDGMEFTEGTDYSVSYDGDYTISSDDEEGLIKDAQLIISAGSGDLRDSTGEGITVDYQIIVGESHDLVDHTSLKGISYSYSEGTYSSQVVYTNEDGEEKELVEGSDYVAAYKIDSSNYTVTVTITGVGLYYGSVTFTFDELGRESKILTVRTEEELDNALANEVEYIFIGKDITLTQPLEIIGNVMINGSYTDEDGNSQQYTLTVSDSVSTNSGTDAVIAVTAGSAVLSDLTIEFNGQSANALYVETGATLTVTGGTVLNDLYCRANGSVAYIQDGGTLTLKECTLTGRGNGGTGRPIYNAGTLTVDGAYLTGINSSQCAVENLSTGTLNWISGVFDVDSVGYFGDSQIGCAVIENYGLFNMTGGTINGFLKDGSGDRTDAYCGAVCNRVGATFNMSGGTITGFTSSSEHSNNENPSGGGGVYNLGTFTLSGDACITDNVSLDSSSGTIGMGGGVFNGGVFYMKGGVISNNTATLGGGVYNDSTRESNYRRDDAPEFYMTGGTISGNCLTSDSIDGSITGGGMGFDNSTSVTNIGSALFVCGDSIAVISGGTIDSGEDSDEITVTLSDNDTEDALVEKIPVGIAVAPSVHTDSTGAHTQNVYTEAGNATLTITGNPNIEVGVLLFRSESVSETANLTNYVDLVNDSDLRSDLENYEYTENGDYTDPECYNSWLVLDGGLNTQITINTLTMHSLSITFEQLTSIATGTNWIKSVSEVYYTANDDGDIVAVYKDRVTARESDGDLLNAYRIYLDQTEIDGVACDAWIICTCNTLEWSDRVAPTCTEDGRVACYQCPVCGRYYGENLVELTEEQVTLSATGHSVVWVEAADPTCTENGYVAHYECANCGTWTNVSGTEVEIEEGQVIPATGHTWAIIEAVPATCTESGLTAGIACSVCGEVLLEQAVVSPTGHFWNERTDATGTTYYVCGNCGEIVDENGDPYEPVLDEDEEETHDWTVVEGYPATCTEDGLTDGVYCEDCGEWLVPQEVIPATRHALYYWEAEDPANCTTDGHIAYYECLNCGKLFADENAGTELSASDIVVSASHSLTSVSAVSPTCTDAGNIAYYKCTVCGKLFSDQNGTTQVSAADVIVPATGHDRTRVVAQSATCESSGNKEYYKCETCGKLYSNADMTIETTLSAVTIAPTGHYLEYVAAVSATSTTSGHTAYYHCVSCGKYYSDENAQNEITWEDIVIPATGTSGTVSSGTGSSTVVGTGTSSGSSSSGTSSGSSGGTTIIRSGSSTVVSTDDEDEEDAEAEGEEDEENAEDTDEAETSEEASTESVSSSVSNHSTVNITPNYDSESLMNDTDKALVAAGGIIEFVTSIKDISEASVDDDTLTAIAKVEGEVGSLVAAHYLDISMTKYVNDIGVSVTETLEPVEFTIEVPEDMLNEIGDTEGDFYMVRVHNDVVDLLPTTYDEETHTVTFSTDEFSTYALVFLTPNEVTEPVTEEPTPVEEAAEEAEETGGTSWLFWLIDGIIAAVVIAAIVVVVVMMSRSKKKANNKSNSGTPKA